MLKHHLLALAAASFVCVSTTHAGSFASTVISYDRGTGFAASHTNASTALGAPSVVNPFGDTVPFDPPYDPAQIVSVGTGGSLTVGFPAPVSNSPSNRFGIDFTIYGNTGFIITNDFSLETFDWVGTPATDGSFFGNNIGSTRVFVSQDGTNFYQLDPALAPTVDHLFPTDGAGDPQIPVNPALTANDFSGLTLEQIRAVYDGSAGGSGYDISWARDTNGNPVSISWINYVRVEVLSDRSEIDAISSTAPLILTQPVNQTVTNAGTDITFSVVAEGAISYQWQWNGTDLVGATSSSLTLPDAFVTANAGNYTVIVSSAGGSVVSSVATLNKPVSPAIYCGLFHESNAIQHASSGYFSFTIGKTRSFNGKLLIDGGSHGLSGKFGSNHQAQVVIVRTNKPTNLSVHLQLLTANAADEVIGAVTDGNWTSPLSGDRAVYSTNNPAPQTGVYTLTLVTDSNGETSPSHGSYGLVTVKTNGAVKLKGLLSDATTLSQASYVSKDGQWPLYVPVYKGTGSLLGWITFTNEPGSKLIGNVSWSKTGAYGLYYTNGFTNSLTVYGGSRRQ
jgi:hypothetical protein